MWRTVKGKGEGKGPRRHTTATDSKQRRSGANRV